jgi:tellurite resistance-related uncharacterized protein
VKKENKKGPIKVYANIRKGRYKQTTIKKKLEVMFLDNEGKIITHEQIIEVAKEPVSEKQPENWHQRLSELRTDDGYTILPWRNRGWLRVEEYFIFDNGLAIPSSVLSRIVYIQT